MNAAIAILAIFILVYRAWYKKSLTLGGIVAAILTAVAHALNPWSLPFVLLVTFFLAGSRATEVKKYVKASLTLNSTGSSGGEGPRTYRQVLANSIVASALSIAHAYKVWVEPAREACFLAGEHGGDLLVVGIIAHYACVTADTFSSELGILAPGEPRLITSPTLRRVPRGTNGGVSLLGLGAGFLGSLIIVATASTLLPFCDGPPGQARFDSRLFSWPTAHYWPLLLGLVAWGGLGSVLDSFLGALFQRTVRDVRSGKVVEGEGGVRVLVSTQTDAHRNHSRVYSRLANARTTILQGEGKEAAEKTEPVMVEGERDGGKQTFGPDAQKHERRRRPSSLNELPSRVIENGWDLLDNNQVNLLMAFTMSVGAMVIASWYWRLPLYTIMPEAGIIHR